MPKFVVISGKKQCGKTTLAQIICKELEDDGYAAEIISFADPLKRMCHMIFGIPLELMYGSDKDKETLTTVQWDGFSEAIRLKYSNHRHKKTIVKSKSLVPAPRSGVMTVREVLQIMGTDIFREQIDQDVWAKAPFNRRYESDVIVIADCRFENELKYAEKASAVLIRIERDTGLEDVHASEIGLDNIPNSRFDLVFNNNGSMDELNVFADSVISVVEDDIANLSD